MKALMFLARRFVAGTTIDEAVPKVRELNDEGIKVTLDVLGENVSTRDLAEKSGDAYLTLLDRIDRDGLDANVSLKLTQMGLDIDTDFCADVVGGVVDRAAEYDNFVRLDMEGSTYTDATIAMFERLFARHGNVGVVLQAMLHRTPDDVRTVLDRGGRIRLCKGAYKEPPAIALQKMPQIRERFTELVPTLLTSGIYHGVATHDEKLIAWTIDHVRREGIDPASFEFQMLYGMRRERQRELVREGYNVRCYVPYGTHWFPYFTRRLRERKENVFFVLKHLFKK